MNKLNEDARTEACPTGLCTGTFALSDSDSEEVKHVMVFRNGLVAAFDHQGNQIPDMQGHIIHLLKNAARHIQQNRDFIQEAKEESYVE